MINRLKDNWRIKVWAVVLATLLWFFVKSTGRV